ncbi:hypothetical protein J3F83DRAFT_755699 [Trichoderma novae-zelandiae]
MHLPSTISLCEIWQPRGVWLVAGWPLVALPGQGLAHAPPSPTCSSASLILSSCHGGLGRIRTGKGDEAWV